MRSLQNEDLSEDGAVSLKKVFQFLHQVSMASSHLRWCLGICVDLRFSLFDV